MYTRATPGLPGVFVSDDCKVDMTNAEVYTLCKVNMTERNCNEKQDQGIEGAKRDDPGTVGKPGGDIQAGDQCH